MKIKPSKCRSFSIRSGTPEAIHFNLADYQIPSIAEEEQKYLGRLLFFNMKPKEAFKLLKEKLKEKLENLDSTEIRNEFKVKIYKEYLLPSIRFLLTVHEIQSGDLDSLDVFTDQFLKKWCGLARCATRMVLHCPTALDIPSVSALYREAHTVAHVTARLKADIEVQDALNNKLEREREIVKWNPIIVQAEQMYEQAMQANAPLGQTPTDLHQFNLEGVGAMEVPPDAPKSPLFIEKVKDTAKAYVRGDETADMHEKAKTLISQGRFLDLSLQEKCDATWKSYIYNLSKGTMKWILNSTVNSLPTLSNLKTWGKAASDKCKLCGWKQTLKHITSGCRKALNQGRFTFRHDNILAYIADSLDRSKCDFYIDIPDHQTAAAGTVPPSLTVTNLKPDVVIIGKNRQYAGIFELTVPNEENIEERHNYKANKYSHFENEISLPTVLVEPFEIGANTGYINARNKITIKKIHAFVKPNISLKSFTNNLSAISVLSSYYVYQARNQQDWVSPGRVHPPLKK